MESGWFLCELFDHQREFCHPLFSGHTIKESEITSSFERIVTLITLFYIINSGFKDSTESLDG